MAVDTQRTTSVPGLTGFARPHRRRHRALIVIAASLATLLVAAIVASFISVPYYAITPGRALNVSQLISVGGTRAPSAGSATARAPRGEVLLTDVEVLALRAIDYPYYAWFDHGATVVSASALTGPATTAQYNEQGVIDMATARQAATVVALRTLGYPVQAVADGVIVYQAEPGSPAASAFTADDVITAVDAHRVTSFASLAAALARRTPGSAVAVAVRRFASKRVRVDKVRLGEQRVLVSGRYRYAVCRSTAVASRLPAYEPHGSPLGCLGLTDAPGGSEVAYAVTGLPFAVDLQAEGIVGPSAGLAFTLGLLEKLDRSDLTGGRRIAATGTMAIDGSVGDVGGVAQKTAAVRAAGASVFLVPPQELAVARAHAGPHLEVLAVSSAAAAVRDLEHLGGILSRATRSS